MAKARSLGPSGNGLLARLPQAELLRLKPHLQAVSLSLKQILYEANSPIEYVYFPSRGTLSAVTVMENGGAIEVATIGNEGAAGVGVILGSNISPNRVFVQLAGEALRIKVKTLRAEIQQDNPLRGLLLLYLSAFFGQVSQSVACNGLHPVPKRCCRWLLMTHDRTIGDELTMTHEFLAIMLGVRRAGVTEVLQTLQLRGWIRHHRGLLTVLNRKGLESGTCECYRTVRDEYDRVLEPFPIRA